MQLDITIFTKSTLSKQGWPRNIGNQENKEVAVSGLEHRPAYPPGPFHIIQHDQQHPVPFFLPAVRSQVGAGGELFVRLQDIVNCGWGVEWVRELVLHQYSQQQQHHGRQYWQWGEIHRDREVWGLGVLVAGVEQGRRELDWHWRRIKGSWQGDNNMHRVNAHLNPPWHPHQDQGVFHNLVQASARHIERAYQPRVWDH